MPRKVRKNIEEFKDKGLSIRQVSRLTGISFGLSENTTNT